MERTGYGFAVQYESVFGGEKIDYVVANSKEEVERMYANKNVDYVTNETASKISFSASESEIKKLVNS